MELGFTVDVVEGDALDFETDVLMVKDAAFSGGLDAVVRGILKRKHEPTFKDRNLGIGDYMLTEAPSTMKCHYILTVGTVGIFQLDYGAMRQLGHDMLAGLYDSGVAVKHVTTTLHGVNTALGNDEVESFRSLLLGFADAFEAGLIPPTLERVTIIERELYRVELLKDALNKFLPPRTAEIDRALHETADSLKNILAGVDSFEGEYQKPVADETSPHVFVAMPFAEEFDDQYYLAIRPAVTANDVLCVRLDQQDSVFTGDIMDQVKKRIETAKLVIALLDKSNPNVYLEVGYAWGVGTPTLLILHEEEKPPFDVQNARLLTYNRIHKLKDQLMDELRHLLT